MVEVLTSVGADRDLRLEDLPIKGHERVFAERVPLPPRMRDRIELHEADEYGEVAETGGGLGLPRHAAARPDDQPQQTAETWFAEEYEPAVDLLRQTGLLGGGPESTETEAYLRLSAARYRLLRSHAWDDATVARLRGTLDRDKERVR